MEQEERDSLYAMHRALDQALSEVSWARAHALGLPQMDDTADRLLKLGGQMAEVKYEVERALGIALDDPDGES
ncbi:hypothetical protein ACIGB8_28165 [Promicromonospora sukumoe]|uniref:hypothetical protein n=1 Tax=Promicromonospora sukumoe TaxID=88382 RepID=UPI0037C8D0D6